MSFVGKACIKRENYASGPVFLPFQSNKRTWEREKNISSTERRNRTHGQKYIYFNICFTVDGLNPGVACNSVV